MGLSRLVFSKALLLVLTCNFPSTTSTFIDITIHQQYSTDLLQLHKQIPRIKPYENVTHGYSSLLNLELKVCIFCSSISVIFNALTRFGSRMCTRPVETCVVYAHRLSFRKKSKVIMIGHNMIMCKRLTCTQKLMISQLSLKDGTRK